MALAIAVSGPAHAVTIGTGLGLDAGYACPDPATSSCFAERDFKLLEDVNGDPIPAAATGTITLGGGPVLFTIVIDLDVASLTMEDTSGAFDGVDRIEFTSLMFDVVLADGWQAQDFLATGTATGLGTVLGTVTGTYEQFLGATSKAGPTGFTESVSFSNFICDTDGAGQCGFEVGFVNSAFFPSLIEPVGVTAGGSDHQFAWTFNVVIPEPSTAALIGLGLAGLAALLRRRA